MTISTRARLLAGVSFAFGLTANAAVAQTAVQSSTVQPSELGEIVVTASGFEQRINQAPASISVIPRAEIEEVRAVSIAEILNNVEGVDTGAAVGKSGGQTINIRGMGSDYTLILIDGRRQNTAGSVTPNGFGETATSFLPPVSAIDRVEVVRGPVSTLYGSDAMGGVVNIITRKIGDDWHGSATAHYTLQGDDEFGDIRGGDVYLAGPLVADRVGVSIRASRSEREQSRLTYETVAGVQTPVSGFGRSATANQIWSAGGRVAFNLHPDHDLWIDGDVTRQWYDNSKGQMGTATTAGGYDKFLEFNRDQIAVAHNWRLPFGVLESNYSVAKTETRGRIIPNGVAGAGGGRTLESENRIFDTKLFSQWRNHTFTVGGQHWDAEMTDGVVSGTFNHTQWAIFAEDEWRFTDGLALTLGARHDDHSTFGSHFSPRAYLVWNPNAVWTVKGGVSQGFKTPRLEQLASGINGFGAQGRLPLLGSPGLMPETSTSTEFAVLYDDHQRLRAGITVFHNQFDDKIATGVPIANCLFKLTPEQYAAGGYNTSGCYDVGFYTAYISTVPTFGQSVNIDEAVTKGVEATARFRFDDAWTLQGNYTFTDSEQKSGAAAGQPLTDTPEHMLNANLRWVANDRMNLWLRGEYRSSRYRGAGDAQTALGDYKAYSLFHLGGAYRVDDNLTVNAVVYNVFDKDFVSLLPYGTPVAYAPEFANNQEPRRLWVSVTAAF
ncbi:MAG: TonB-dependent receptor [Candidatus Brevundimonas colombiensis]|jgi:outer membrane receptor for ferrienterochelin and colicins|uniref:TonB-dependent receptor n=1 Tax=Candidatus Brevundimonas colombiensis TaxID=3121376 RepID=A0AAJ5X0K7_9CAUL|nr:TonB-dependent receptor [Brevundimonas sp.]WEK40779.1 MAG: TonB-dependent receptor [Brevundimonas sp.]